MGDLQGTLEAIKELEQDLLYATKPKERTIWDRDSSEREPDYEARCSARTLLRLTTATSESYSARYRAATAVGIKITAEEIDRWVEDLTDRLSDPALQQDAVEDARKLNDLLVGRNRELSLLVGQVNARYPREASVSCIPDDYAPEQGGFSNTQKALFGGALAVLAIGYAARRYATR